MRPVFDRRAIPEGASETLWHAADGHPIRRIEWPAPAAGTRSRGSMLFMAGRGDAYEKYLETFEDWRLRGWQVTALDWRGQGGSGRLGKDDSTGHIDDFATWVADLARFWREWSAGRQGPLVLVGHSMGGHLTLRAAVEHALDPQPAAMVLSAPMLDTFPELLPIPVKQLFARLMVAVGDPARPAWKISEKPGARPEMRQLLLTHDDVRYDDERWWREHRPELKLGPGSWAWVQASAESSAAIFADGALEKVDVPVFFIATEADKLVSPKAIHRAVARLPHAEALVFGKEARHEILREVDHIREMSLAAIDAFLDSHAPA